VIRVVIVDDHAMIREGLRAALSSRPDLAIVGEAATGNEAVAICEQTTPDVVVMDLDLPDIDGATATRRILDTQTTAHVVVLTMHADDNAVLRAVRAGARGYVLKDADRDEIERAIRTVAGGGTVFGGTTGDRLLDAVTGAGRQSMTPFPQLTDRERELLELVAQGRSNTDIARLLFLSQKTVRNRVSTVFSKLGVSDRPQAIVTAREAGFGKG
jgi:DNA-binding NarL/FixJ family response regulator